jgi:hypothetical protein
MQAIPDMSALFPDTSPEAEEVLLSLMREAPAWRKVEMVWELTETVRMLARTGLKTRYPHAGPGELDRRLAALVLGPDLAERVYGPTPEPW